MCIHWHRCEQLKLSADCLRGGRAFKPQVIILRGGMKHRDGYLFGSEACLTEDSGVGALFVQSGIV